jgi:hypothetical protein
MLWSESSNADSIVKADGTPTLDQLAWSEQAIDQEGYSIEHIAEFAKVALALAVELGGGASVVQAQTPIRS